MVSRTQSKNALGDSRTRAAVTIAARRIAVPVASGWNAQTASYGLSL
jgi:hypothetical protein